MARVLLLAFFAFFAIVVPGCWAENATLVVDGLITVYNNISDPAQALAAPLACSTDLALCPNSFQASALGQGPTCGHQIICCPLATNARTIPRYVPTVTRADISSNPLMDYHRCSCQAVEYTFMYLEEVASEWFTRTMPVRVGFQCDWSLTGCTKFLC